jgi:predicted dehydrogenase
MAMDSVRIGLIGAGLIGGVHSAALAQIRDALGPKLELVAVADPLAEPRSALADLYGYRRTFAEADELLECADVNAVFICTPTVHHAALVQAAAERGLHIFCEKPLSMTLAEAEAMHAAVHRAGVSAQIGLVLRYSAVYTVMRQMSREAAGKPMAVLFRDDQCFPIRGLHGTAWRGDRTQSAGGTLIEHGVHDLDLLTWFFGPVATLRAWQQHHSGHAGIEDYMAVELQFESGLRAQLVNVWHDMVQRSSNRRLEIFCEKAFIASDHDMSGNVLVQSGDGDEQTVSADEVLQRFMATRGRLVESLRNFYGVAYLVQDLAFVEALLAGRPPVPDMRAGVEAHRLAAAAYRSAETGAEIELATFASSA